MKRLGVKKFDRTTGPLFIADGEDYEFATNTGKIELYSTELAELNWAGELPLAEHDTTGVKNPTLFRAPRPDVLSAIDSQDRGSRSSFGDRANSSCRCFPKLC